MRKSTVSHFAILKGWYFIISFAKKSANDHNKPKYGGKGKRQNQVEYLKSFDVNVWWGWYSWQDGECRARKGGINGYSLRHGRRLFSFQDRNWPSLSQKTIWYFEEFYQTKYFFDMFIGTLAADSYVPPAAPVIMIWVIWVIWEWRLTWLGILCGTFSQAAHK